MRYACQTWRSFPIFGCARDFSAHHSSEHVSQRLVHGEVRLCVWRIVSVCSLLHICAHLRAYAQRVPYWLSGRRTRLTVLLGPPMVPRPNIAQDPQWEASGNKTTLRCCGGGGDTASSASLLPSPKSAKQRVKTWVFGSPTTLWVNSFQNWVNIDRGGPSRRRAHLFKILTRCTGFRINCTPPVLLFLPAELAPSSFLQKHLIDGADSRNCLPSNVKPH